MASNGKYSQIVLIGQKFSKILATQNTIALLASANSIQTMTLYQTTEIPFTQIKGDFEKPCSLLFNDSRRAFVCKNTYVCFLTNSDVLILDMSDLENI